MNMYQADFNLEDFRMQEVPAGFDFGSYGKKWEKRYNSIVIDKQLTTKRT